ncbi:similar to Protein CXorf17 homolog (predicted), isoform CRA_b [Rattus norvegicus]|uniref:Similar to Protein CXorf17 homolog (Predicted), isoform CRA_b n=1 Tax=Rattus norvegicus TaxID=10116 RepID=A6KLA4_RAT|nr:similar to Protein CXorf17 homolog (predicted), isoform CRA_b [Rattus norvegicus]
MLVPSKIPQTWTWLARMFSNNLRCNVTTPSRSCYYAILP